MSEPGSVGAASEQTQARAEAIRDALVFHSSARAREGLAALDALLVKLAAAEQENAKWLAWSGGSYPDDSPGDVIHATSDGMIVLDDGITTWNPIRALDWIERRREDNAERALGGDAALGRKLAAAERERDLWERRYDLELARAQKAEGEAFAVEKRAERLQEALAGCVQYGEDEEGREWAAIDPSGLDGALAALAAAGGGHDRPESAAAEGEQQTEQPT
jgi:hypothetical protein